MPRKSIIPSVLIAAFSCVSSLAVTASADTSTIKRPGAHPRYSFEAEPHLLVGLFNPPGPAGGNGFGVGFRGTVVVVDNGFIKRINNSVGIGFGIDWLRYSSQRTVCVQENNVPRCFSDDDFEVDYFWLPVVMQWNFWLSRNWSVFGEPGLAIRFAPDQVDEVAVDPFQLHAGGRYHFSDSVSLTMRIGYPTFSVGVSFLL